MDSGQQNIVLLGSEEEFVDTDNITGTEDESQTIDAEFSDEVQEKDKSILQGHTSHNVSSTPEIKSPVSEQILSDFYSPVPSEVSIVVNSHGKLELKTDVLSSSYPIFDEVHRNKRRSRLNQGKLKSRLSQTQWNWEEDLKLLALHSDNLFFAKLLSEGYVTELQPGAGLELPNGLYQYPFQLKQFERETNIDNEDFLIFRLEKEAETEFEGQNDYQLASSFKTLSSVGPPQILQYLRESCSPYVASCCHPVKKQQVLEAYESLDEDIWNYIVQLDEAAQHVIVNHPVICQFCGKETTVNPYCCEAYQQFLRFLHPNGQALNEILARKSGLYFRSRLTGKGTRAGHSELQSSSDRLANKKRLRDQESGLQLALKNPNSSKAKSQLKYSKPKDKRTVGKASSRRSEPVTREKSTEKAAKPNITSSQIIAKNVTSSTSLPKDASRSLVSIQNRNAVGSNVSLYQQARPMKTISYQLSSKKCLEDGWTFGSVANFTRRKTADDYENLILISQQKENSGMLIKQYDNGSTFAVIFPDGSGNIFHPSGRVAISVVQVGLGLYSYIIQDDSEESEILAIFQPDGHACAHYNNGKLRISLSPTGGVEVDQNGAKKKKWLWHDMYDLQQRAPLQPITIGITPECGIRIKSQLDISVTYSSNCRNIRLNVGTRLMLASPVKPLAPRDVRDADKQFRKDIKNRVETLINQIMTVLEFPKCAKKLDNIPVLLHQRQPQKFERRQPVSQGT